MSTEVGAWLAGYLAALQVGYYVRVREENEVYARPRPPLLVGGVPLERVTERESEVDRLAVIREAHDAGLHGPGSFGCAWCMPRGVPGPSMHGGGGR